MKRNSVLLILIFCIAVYSCNNQSAKPRTLFNTSLTYYKKVFPDYKYKYDSVDKYIYLQYYALGKLNEMLVFDSNENFRYYVYYNTVCNEPRYTLQYSRKGKVVQEDGKPVYVSSEFFGNPVGANDSFSAYINIATPPYFNSSFAIFGIQNDVFRPIKKGVLEKNQVTLFVGRMHNESQKRYSIVTQLTNPFDSNWIRIDTVYFSIKK